MMADAQRADHVEGGGFTTDGNPPCDMVIVGGTVTM